jgi:hypothetical protein
VARTFLLTIGHVKTGIELTFGNFRAWILASPDRSVELRSSRSSSSSTDAGRRSALLYLLLIYNCERSEPADRGFEKALAAVNGR